MPITYLDEQPVKSKITYLDEATPETTPKKKGWWQTYLKEAQPAFKLAVTHPETLLGKTAIGTMGKPLAPEELEAETQKDWSNIYRGTGAKEKGGAGVLPFAKSTSTAGQLVPQIAGEMLNLGTRPSTYIAPKLIPPALKLGGKAISKVNRGIERTGALVSGIEPEVLAETRALGYRNVLNKKYYNKKVPEQIIDTIDQNIEGLKKTASQKYNEITTPIRQEKFDYNQILNDLNKLSLKIRQNPFKGPTKGLDTRIVETLRSPNIRVRTLGDVLDLRRNLDQELFTAKGQGIKSAYGKEVRDIFNKYLHKNEVLAKADNEWYTLQRILEDNQKVIGESGENYLSRWSKLTTKQKENLSLLEKELLEKDPTAMPFVDDLTKYSLAQNYLSRASQAGPVGILGKATRPAFRAYLRGLGTTSKVPFKTTPTP